MSRLRRFAHSLLSGYLLLGVNVVFTLAAVPLALHYLSTREFGLWANITQIAIYIALLDFGLSGSAARILIDYKDHPEKGDYGSIIQTDVLVGLAQAGLILVVGTVLAFVIGPLLKIPPDLQPEFFWLVMGQCGVTATMFVTRIVAHVLNANQRYDVNNYNGACGLVANFSVMWWSFARGDGVFSMLWGQAASVLLVLILNFLGCVRLRLLPQRGQWGRPSWTKFRELFSFGWDISLYSLGAQFVSASQTLLVTRLLGLEAATVWNVYTRAMTLLVQVIGRIFDFSASALAEMMVRKERDHLLSSFRQIVVLSVNLAVVAGTIYAVTNSPFVHIWKAGKVFGFPWPARNDALLGLWLVVMTTVRVHTGLVGQSKAIHFMRYIFFMEGLVFITLTVLLHQFGGITMMLGLSLFCSLCFSLPYGLWRTRQYFGLQWRDLVRWHRSTVWLAITVIPLAGLTWWLVRDLPAVARLVAAGTGLGAAGMILFLRLGLEPSLRATVTQLAPPRVRPVLFFFGLSKPEP